ncbi:hypothetical protein M0R45_002221 [Rubus argutus]|uniref:Uncharacterized protein n=1 Tax=Rubus argutus TaxID=59490 RepID=A0AAW1VDR3_RUBAR
MTMPSAQNSTANSHHLEPVLESAPLRSQPKSLRPTAKAALLPGQPPITYVASPCSASPLHRCPYLYSPLPSPSTLSPFCRRRYRAQLLIDVYIVVIPALPAKQFSRSSAQPVLDPSSHCSRIRSDPP